MDDQLDAVVSSAVQKSRMDAHEIVCATRYASLESALTRIHERLDKWGLTVAGALITGGLSLATAVLQFVLHVH